MTTSIKITELADIGGAIAPSTLVPVVNMAGTPETDKANLQIVGNLILGQAGGVNFVPAAKSVLAASVTNNAQPNITSTGTLTNLTVNGNVDSGNVNSAGIFSTGTVRGSTVTALDQLNTANLSANGLATLARLNVTNTVNLGAVANVHITGGTTGQVLRTDGAGGLSWVAQSGGGGTPGGSDTQIQFNDAGSFGGNTGFTFNKTSGVFTSPFLAGNGNGLSNIQGGNVSGTVANATYAASAGSSTSSTNAAALATTLTSTGTAYIPFISATATGNYPHLSNANFSANLANGAITATTFVGELSGTANTALKIANGTSNINIPAINGNIALTVGGSNTWTFDTTGRLTNPGNVLVNGQSLYVGAGSDTQSLTGETLVIYHEGQQYVQAALINAADTGSADWVAYGHNATDEGGWADMGFTGISYNDPNFTITGPGDGYVFVEGFVDDATGGNFVLATGNHGTTKDIIFATGGFAAENEFGRISDANNALELTRTNSNINLVGGGGIIGAGNLYVYPDSNDTSGRLDIFLTTGPDIHIAGVGENLILGRDDTANVTVGVDGNVYIQADYGTAYTWQFGGDSHLIVPGNIESINTGFSFSSTITGITTGNPTVLITLQDSAFPGPVTGQVVISGVLGTTQANGTWWYRTTDNNEFELFTDSTLSTPVNGTTWTAYVSGGLAVCAGYNDISVRGGNVSIRGGVHTWTFNDYGSTIFPTLNVDLHNGGNQNAQTLQFGDPEIQAVITGPTPALNNSAQRLIIQGQRGTGTGEGGDVYVWGGDSDVNGGDIKIYAGDSDGATGGGGYLNMSGGQGADTGGYINIDGGYSSNGSGGYININGGYGGNGIGGNIQLQGGQSSGTGINGANVLLIGGYSQSANGGAVTLRGGQSALGLSGYGNVVVQAGASSWTFDNTGNLVLPSNSFAINYANGTQAQFSQISKGNSNVNIPDTNGNVYITSNGGTQQQWSFDTTGLLRTPGDISIYGGTTLDFHQQVGNITWGTSYMAFSQYGRVELNTNLYANANTIGAQYLKGDGSNITNVNAVQVINGTSNVTVPTTNGNVVVTTSGTYNWTFDNTGNLTVPGNLIAATASPAPILSGFGIVSAEVFTSSVVAYSVLPSATTAGRRAFINNANLVASGNFGAIVSGGGSNTVPVYSDGTDWRIG